MRETKYNVGGEDNRLFLRLSTLEVSIDCVDCWFYIYVNFILLHFLWFLSYRFLVS